MNNLYVIRKEDPIQLVDEVGPIQDAYDLTGINDSLPLDLDDSDRKKRIEYRYHKRFQLNKDAFALIRPIPAGPLKIYGKSMGCIACAVFNAQPAKLGKIDSIPYCDIRYSLFDKLRKAGVACSIRPAVFLAGGLADT